MPKKFKGENTKAVEALNRKAAADAEKIAVARQAAEEDAWRDDDKLTNKKAQRKVRSFSRISSLSRVLTFVRTQINPYLK